ncbi:MAG TPA: DUF5335 family protein, partial [Tepidisphaeraceae bacterium]|nr:DUF5335 family protein [Tepidisphaeraceae bacterium]
EIPFEEWPQVIDQFGRAHQGKMALVALTAPATGTRRLCEDRPLLGVVDERHGRPDESVTVMWNAAGGASSHTIQRPARASIAEWNDAYSAELEIASAQGERLVVRAGPESQLLEPGMVTDGILLERQP